MTETKTERERRRAHLPGFGLRSLKTALSAALCAVIYMLAGRNPTFACIGVVFGIGTDIDSSYQVGGTRFVGTMLGGFIGMGAAALEYRLFPNGNMPLAIALMSVGIMLLISLSLILHWPNAVQPGSVIMCIVLFNTPKTTYMLYALNRIVDTGVGVIFGIVINWLLPRERMERWAARFNAGR